jgi:hypothetical protein
MNGWLCVAWAGRTQERGGSSSCACLSCADDPRAAGPVISGKKPSSKAGIGVRIAQREGVAGDAHMQLKKRTTDAGPTCSERCPELKNSGGPQGSGKLTWLDFAVQGQAGAEPRSRPWIDQTLRAASFSRAVIPSPVIIYGACTKYRVYGCYRPRCVFCRHPPKQMRDSLK